MSFNGIILYSIVAVLLERQIIPLDTNHKLYFIFYCVHLLLLPVTMFIKTNVPKQKG